MTNMGFRFLWINSVCIIQPHKNYYFEGCDSLEDWSKEAGQMGGYYGKSYVTIAATSDENSKAGFLQHPAGKKEDCVLISEAPDYRLFACKIFDDFRGDVEAARLNSRGWVLQERALFKANSPF
ncbi:hypothetical protein BHE90_003217 [Fusarium euwallaceae]|uniref:Heterokaryon incompatibility domain-containing protein n=1 Tax=Fusarium euwallaceae TaxID=1147111 RepID=A0A430M2M9_9HYPO|nr:hypothetical protein BHE90_003217 [Fusarium euwallaceae]